MQSRWACTVTDGTGADALTPELLLAWDAKTLCCCSCGYDDAVRLHLQVPGQFNILHRGRSAQAERCRKVQKHDVVATHESCIAQTETTAQRMQLRALVIGPQLLARTHMHAKLTAEHANM